MAVVRNSASFPSDKKVLLFDDMLKNDCALFLYDQGVDVCGSLLSFIENGLVNGELCLYAYDTTSSKLQLERTFGKEISSGKLRPFPLGKGYLLKEIEKLNGELRELVWKARSEGLPVRVVVDFGGLVTRHSLNDAIGCVKGIIAKRAETIYSKKLRRGQPFHLAAITSFNLDSLDEDAVRAMVGLHKQVVISTRDGVSTLALNFRTREGPEALGVEVASKEVLEEFVKRHLETVVLSMLRERPMCGYDVIKTIYQRYHTFLSQGTVYPLLYSLEGRGLLAMEKQEGERSKVYTLTDEGKRAANREVQEFVKAQRYLLESIRK